MPGDMVKGCRKKKTGHHSRITMMMMRGRGRRSVPVGGGGVLRRLGEAMFTQL